MPQRGAAGVAVVGVATEVPGGARFGVAQVRVRFGVHVRGGSRLCSPRLAFAGGWCARRLLPAGDAGVVAQDGGAGGYEVREMVRQWAKSRLGWGELKPRLDVVW